MTDFRTEKNENVEALVDKVSESAVSTPEENHRINAGKQYYALYRARGSATTRSELIKTGPKFLHLAIVLSSGLATEAEIYEGATVTDNGTALDRRNYNRNFGDNDTGALFFTGPAFSGGLSIRPNQSGFGSNPGGA